MRHSLRTRLWIGCLGILVPVGIAGLMLVVLGGEQGPRVGASVPVLALVLLAAAGAGLWANIALGRRVCAAIEHLRQSTRALSNGAQACAYELKGDDEFSQLSAELARLAAGTLSNQKQAVAHRQTLESEIRTRTIELQQKNLALAFQNEKVIEANRLKSAFLANVSHELRTPLNAIIALSDMLRDQVGGPLQPEQQKQVELIGKSGENLLHLIDEVLDLSRIEAGRMQEDRKRVAIIDLLVETAEGLRPLAQKKGLEIRIESEGSGHEVCLDGEKIRQVLINLLGNAIKFTVKGTITVRLRLLEEEDMLCAEVQDTGPGIPPHQHHAIFEEFRRLEYSVDERVEGSGLGLTIGKKLVSLMGGDLWLDSVPGAGSRFTFIIPLRTAQEQEQPRSSGARRASLNAGSDLTAADDRKRVLLVDDDIVESGVLTRHLRRRKLDILTAHDMREAIQILHREDIDLLLMDLLSQGDEGFRLIEHVTRDPSLQKLPILVNSARRFTAEERAFLESSVGGVFEKGSRGVDELMGLVGLTVQSVGGERILPHEIVAEDVRKAA